MRLRFAPSPTGRLHVGNARTALFNWLLARRLGGTFILRIEDTDVQRSTGESEAAIIDDLQWLGLDWDEGPDTGGPRGPYRSSERLQLYASWANELIASGEAYYCFCSPDRLEAERQAAIAAGAPARYSGVCRDISIEDASGRIAAGERPAIRFRVPDGQDVVFTDAVRGDVRFSRTVIGDPVILRAEGTPAYNFAVVVDDGLMGITHVIRGEDHISNTPRQILIYQALGFSLPVFAHVSLVMGPDHTPLSKRHGATSVAEFREKGYLPEALLNYLALVGWSPRDGASGQSPGDHSELMSVSELVDRFSLDAVGSSAGVFDEEKLSWVNRHHLKLAEPARIAGLSLSHFARAGLAMAPDSRGLEFLSAVMPIASGSVDRLDEVPARLSFLFEFSPDAALADAGVREEMRRETAQDVARALADELAAAPRLDREAFRAVAGRVRARTGQKGRALFHPIRVALMARPEGPELDLAVPAVDLGADLPVDAGVPRILGCRERAAAFLRALERSIV